MSATITPGRTPPTSENCRFCWMCRHVCPVAHVTSRETLTPHAWALTIESVRRGQLAWNDETAAVMYACADCGLCRSHCVTDQPLPDAIVSARAAIVREGRAPASVLSLARQLENAAAVTQLRVPAGERALFAGGLGTAAAAEVTAAAELLAIAGIPAPVAGDGCATGLVESSLGLVDLARRIARDLVDAVEASGVTELLVLRPADKWTFEYVYPTRLGVAWPATVRVTETTMALAEAYAGGRLSLRRRDDPPPAYHDPCHGPRLSRDATGPRRLLAAIYGDRPAPELFWRAGRAHPCGAIGGLDLTHPDLARQLTLARIHDAQSAGAAAHVTDDPACLAELQRHARDGMVAAGLYSLLRGQLRT
jgi:Fe-S oxidoreductase